MVSSYQGNWQTAQDFNKRGPSVSPSDVRRLGARMLLEHEIGDGIEGHECQGRFVESQRQVMPGPRYDYA